MATNWMDLLFKSAPSILNTGMGLYDYFKTKDAVGNLQSASTSGLVDPFGQANRQGYQQQLANLRADPGTYVRNLPGYQFSLDEMTRGVNRQAAKAGHYLGTGRLHNIAERTRGLAEQTYGDEHARLERLAGAGMQPNAAAYAALQQNAVGANVGSMGKLMDVGKGLLDSPIGKAGLGLIKDKAGSLWDQYGPGGTDPNPSLGGGVSAPTSLPGTDTRALSSGVVPGGDFDALNTGGGDAGVDSLYGDMPGPLAPGSAGTGTQVPGTLSESLQGYKDMVKGGNAYTGALGAAGGYLGGELGAKLNLTGTPLDRYSGSVLGSTAGGALAGAAGGTGIGAGALAAGGPAAIAGAALIIGQGIAGVVKKGKARTKAQNRYQTSAGKVLGGNLVADPTGAGAGQGYSIGDYFLPEKHYSSLLNKLHQGDYLDPGATAAVQGSYAYKKDPTTGAYTAGRFGNVEGQPSFDPRAWSALGAGETMGSAQKLYQQQVAKARSLNQFRSGGGLDLTGEAANKAALTSGLGQQYTTTTTREGEQAYKPLAGTYAARQQAKQQRGQELAR